MGLKCLVSWLLKNLCMKFVVWLVMFIYLLIRCEFMCFLNVLRLRFMFIGVLLSMVVK